LERNFGWFRVLIVFMVSALSAALTTALFLPSAVVRFLIIAPQQSQLIFLLFADIVISSRLCVKSLGASGGIMGKFTELSPKL
jgi:membrane associated rhomboid family serine protease